MEYKTPEEILVEQYACSSFDDLKQKLFNNGVGSIDTIIDAMSRYGKQQYNKAVFDCVENAEVCFTEDCVIVRGDAEIDKDSMLKLLKQ